MSQLAAVVARLTLKPRELLAIATVVLVPTHARASLAPPPGVERQDSPDTAADSGEVEPKRAGAEPEVTVETLTRDAVAAFQAKRYADAAALFERAYELSNKPNLLFNIGRVYEEAGELEQAVTYYQRFIKQPRVALETRKLALERLRVLEQLVEAAQLEVRVPPPHPVPDEPDESDETVTEDGRNAAAARKPRPPRYRRAGWALFGSGAGVAFVGAGFGGAALARSAALDDAAGLDRRRELADQGRAFAIASDVLIATGTAVAVTGAILVAVSFRKARSTARTRVTWDHGFAVRF